MTSAPTIHRDVQRYTFITIGQNGGTDRRSLRPQEVDTKVMERDAVISRVDAARPARRGKNGLAAAVFGSRSLMQAARALPGLVRSAPLTSGLIALMLVTAGVTGAFGETDGDELSAQLGYGLPALSGGHLWRFAVGASILPHPVMYLIMCPLVALAVGYYERRVGALRTAAVLLLTHLAGTLGVAAALSVADGLNWPWASLVAGQTDLGISAGTVGVLAAASYLMRPAIRRRLRWVVSAYLLVMVVRSGLLWDAEHLLGWLTGLAAGPLLAASVPGLRNTQRRPVPRIKLVRSGIAWGMVVLAASRLVTTIYPGNGGIFGNGLPAVSTRPGMIAAATIFAGIVLIVADALRRGLPLAWWAALAVTGLSMTQASVAHVWRYPADMLLWGLMFAGLIGGRGFWPWRLPTGALRRTLPKLLVAIGAFTAGSTLLVWLLRSQINPAAVHVHAHQIIERAVFHSSNIEPHTRAAHALLMLLSLFWAIALLVLLIPLLYASHVPGRRDQALRIGQLSGRERLASMIQRYGGGNLGWQRSWPAFTPWFNAAGDVAVAYKVVSGVAIVIGDPVGPRHKWRPAAAEFQQFCLRAGWTTAWYSVSQRFLDATNGGWKHTQIGEDAVIELPELAFTGKSWQDVRTARNRAEREGIRFHAIDLATAPAELLRGIDEVSRAWVDGKPLPEMGLTLGTVNDARDGTMRAHLALDAYGVVHGVTTWMPVHAGGRVIGWTLDVMRRRPGGFRPVMEFLIAESVLAFQREGCELASLSVAPLARPVNEAEAPLDRLDRTLDRIGEMLEPAYGFRSLLAYKTKFHPTFEPVFLAYRSQVDLAEIAVAIGHAYLPDLTAGQALSIARVLRPGRREPVPA
ncbi:MAG: DUF2156 domain-containing protein [Actinomycetota bacterium]|nr:DUF2156 domain-containing protein [Actinomycetota bacterium]